MEIRGSTLHTPAKARKKSGRQPSIVEVRKDRMKSEARKQYSPRPKQSKNAVLESSTAMSELREKFNRDLASEALYMGPTEKWGSEYKTHYASINDEERYLNIAETSIIARKLKQRSEMDKAMDVSGYCFEKVSQLETESRAQYSPRPAEFMEFLATSREEFQRLKKRFQEDNTGQSLREKVSDPLTSEARAKYAHSLEETAKSTRDAQAMMAAHRKKFGEDNIAAIMASWDKAAGYLSHSSPRSPSSQTKRVSSLPPSPIQAVPRKTLTFGLNCTESPNNGTPNTENGNKSPRKQLPKSTFSSAIKRARLQRKSDQIKEQLEPKVTRLPTVKYSYKSPIIETHGRPTPPKHRTLVLPMEDGRQLVVKNPITTTPTPKKRTPSPRKPSLRGMTLNHMVSPRTARIQCQQ